MLAPPKLVCNFWTIWCGGYCKEEVPLVGGEDALRSLLVKAGLGADPDSDSD